MMMVMLMIVIVAAAGTVLAVLVMMLMVMLGVVVVMLMIVILMVMIVMIVMAAIAYRSDMLDSAIFAGADQGMRTMDQSLLELWKQGAISAETAAMYCLNLETMQKKLQAGR